LAEAVSFPPFDRFFVCFCSEYNLDYTLPELFFDRWHHLACVLNNLATEMVLDGTSVGTRSQPIAVNSSSSLSSLLDPLLSVLVRPTVFVPLLSVASSTLHFGAHFGGGSGVPYVNRLFFFFAVSLSLFSCSCFSSLPVFACATSEFIQVPCPKRLFERKGSLLLSTRVILLAVRPSCLGSSSSSASIWAPR
jgi:hypothetical protein